MTRHDRGTRFGDFTADDVYDAADAMRATRGTGYLTGMADILRAAGLEVTEQEGWQTRARSSGGYEAGRPYCIMWHHAASAPGATTASVANYASYGNPDSPVCNLVLGRDGDVIVCAGGATNTNGKGGPVTMSKGVVPLDSMNTYAIGIEAVNTGVGEPWPQAQIDAYFTMNNALAAAYNLEPDDLHTHNSWCEPSCPGRKIDPATASAVEGPWRPDSINSSGTWAIEDVRAEARRRAAATPPSEDDMTPEQANELTATLAAVNATNVNIWGGPDNPWPLTILGRLDAIEAFLGIDPYTGKPT